MTREQAGASSDRRRQQRAPAAVKVEYRCAGRSGAATTVDIGPEGVFLHTPRPAPAGTAVLMRLYFPGGDPVRVSGTVRRVVLPGSGALPGMGIRFEAVYASTAKIVRDFVEERLGEVRDPASAVERLPGRGDRSFYAARLAVSGEAPPAPAPKTSEEVREWFDFRVEVSWGRILRMVLAVGLIAGGVLAWVRFCVPHG